MARIFERTFYISFMPEDSHQEKPMLRSGAGIPHVSFRPEHGAMMN
jgi:hypothetical protein